MNTSPSAMLEACLAYVVLQEYDAWLGAPSTHGLQAFLGGVEDRAAFTGTAIQDWRIHGPLHDPDFSLPIVALTGHPTLTIRWATALELIHLSLNAAMLDLRGRVEVWEQTFEPDSDPPILVPPLEPSLRHLLQRLASRPAMYLGRKSSWLLRCYLAGLNRGGDWFHLPELPEAREIMQGIEEQSIQHYGSPHGAYRVYEESPEQLLEWVGIAPLPPRPPNPSFQRTRSARR